jgi:hypothetical protein
MLISESHASRRKPLKGLAADSLLLATLSMGVFVGFMVARLPFRIDLGWFTSAYWGGTAAQAMFAAVLLCIAGLPFDQTLLPMWRRYTGKRILFVALAIFGIWMFWLFGFWLGLIVIIEGLALAELLERRKAEFQSALFDIFLPSMYFFLGVLLVYSLNHVIAAIEFAGAYDEKFNRADLLLFGTTASAVSGWMVAHLAPSFFWWMEFAYRSLYAQIGAALVITASLSGRGYALRYVRTLLIAYCLALLAFFLWPSIGPFSARNHIPSRSFPSTYQTQETIVIKARLLWAHNRTAAIETVNLADYYIGFPSMHIAMPLIAIWFLRKWRRIALILLAFDAVMLVSIIALEWHYFVDLLGGVIVAILSIVLTRERNCLGQSSDR